MVQGSWFMVFSSWSGVSATVLLVSAAALMAQGELVVYKSGTKLYHRASCPVVQDLAGAVAMTRGRAESRGYKAHSGCDPDNPNAKAPKAAPPPPQTVYVGGPKYYHRKTCGKLGDPAAVKPISLEIAGKTHWPCPDCKPPVRKRSIENAIPGTKRRGG
ncbi:MAG: hypothetical protein ACRD15_05210 [Vicinamibacterales bacterium]